MLGLFWLTLKWWWNFQWPQRRARNFWNHYVYAGIVTREEFFEMLSPKEFIAFMCCLLESQREQERDE